MEKQKLRNNNLNPNITINKLQPKNGFTIAQCLLVILMVAVIVQVFGVHKQEESLNLFAQNLLNEIQIEQYKAMSTRSRKVVAIDVHHAKTDEKIIDYPRSVTCTYQVLIFNSRGNIAKGGTIQCNQGQEEIHLVFQLGAGRGRVENESEI